LSRYQPILVEHHRQQVGAVELFLQCAALNRMIQLTEQLDNPATLFGDPILPGFTLNLSFVWG
jgi:hypothetical protein